MLLSHRDIGQSSIQIYNDGLLFHAISFRLSNIILVCLNHRLIPEKDSALLTVDSQKGLSAHLRMTRATCSIFKEGIMRPIEIGALWVNNSFLNVLV